MLALWPFVLAAFSLGGGLIGTAAWLIHTEPLVPYKKARRRLVRAHRDIDNIFYAAHAMMDAVTRDKRQPETFGIGGRLGCGT